MCICVNLVLPYVIVGTLRHRLVTRNLRNFTQTKCKLPSAPTDLLWMKWALFPIISNWDSHFKLLTGDPGPTRMVAAKSRKGQTVIGAGVYHPSSGNSNSVDPNGAGIIYTIGGVEQAAIAAAFTHDHIHIAADGLTSLHQIRKHLLHLEKHRHHVLGGILKILSTTISNSQSHIFLYKLKSHARNFGNECAHPWKIFKPATETASHLKQPFAPQALVAIPSLILAG